MLPGLLPPGSPGPAAPLPRLPPPRGPLLAQLTQAQTSPHPHLARTRRATGKGFGGATIAATASANASANAGAAAGTKRGRKKSGSQEPVSAGSAGSGSSADGNA